MGRYDVDLIEGYDSGACLYNEKKEKRYQASVWIGIMVFMGILLIRGIIWHVEEVYAVFNYQTVEAEYNEKMYYAYYKDENGREHQCSLSGHEPYIRDGKVTLYYKEDITKAFPVNTAWFWGKIYLFLGGVMAICIWRISKIYAGKRHSTV